MTPAPTNPALCRAWYQCAAVESTDPFGFDAAYLDSGGQSVIDAYLADHKATGIRGLVLHLPLGLPRIVNESGQHQFTLDMPQRLRSSSAQHHRRLLTVLPPKLRTLVADGHPVLCHVGGFHHNLFDGLRGVRHDKWNDEVTSAFRPMIDAGVDLSIDASALLAPTSREYGYMLGLRDGLAPCRVFVEARPLGSALHWQGWPVYANNSAWLETDVDSYTKRPDGSPFEYGDVVRQVYRVGFEGDAAKLDSLAAEIAAIHADGHTAAVAMAGLVEKERPGFFGEVA